ncbi:MAG: superoxide dismutase [Acidobacteria bacterium]|nr:superoxide dismutase [Acidobacteriota bacterium]
MMPFEVPPLPYDYNALEKSIDEQTMRLHHDKHHAAYVTNLNAALEKAPQQQSHTVEQILRHIQDVPEAVRTAVRNNGGGHANHSMFWNIMSPGGGGEPGGPLGQAINSAFGNLNTFKEQFNDAGVKRFGSGWAWLVRDSSGALKIISTANQDSPLMEGLFPVMGNDVWEHAYYLRYQNRRADYLKAWWDVVNWKEIASRFENFKDHMNKAEGR